MLDINKLKQIRTEQHLTLAMLSQKSGVPISALNDVEKEEHVPNVYLAIQICQALGRSVEEVFKLDN